MSKDTIYMVDGGYPVEAYGGYEVAYYGYPNKMPLKGKEER